MLGAALLGAGSLLDGDAYPQADDANFLTLNAYHRNIAGAQDGRVDIFYLEAALSEESRCGVERKLSGGEEALLVATACSKPPAGRARWTLDLLAGEMVKLTEHGSLSREAARRRLAAKDLKPWHKDMWCIPTVDAEYVARMEDVLDLYGEAPDRIARSSASMRARSSLSGKSESRSREVEAWKRQRNRAGARIKWMFTTDKARDKMGRAYPIPKNES